MDRVNRLEKEVADLRKILNEKETELYELKREWNSNQQQNIQNQQFPENSFQHSEPNNVTKVQFGDKLPKWAIERYSRQILLPDIGVTGQEKICAAKVLIVGAGGLGCPAAAYLAGAGVGEIGIVDYDTVEITNLHRQILHSEKDQFMGKADSAADSLRRLNSHIKVTPYNIQLDSSNALDIASKYDIVLDCTDNVPTRYMLNDLCVITKLPLISGSALKMEGQLTIYGYRAERNPTEKNTGYIGPCYRCVFPAPPPAETVGSCSANGVAPQLPGIIGALQALEAMKYIVGTSYEKLLVERMLLFDGEDITFRTVKLRGRNPQCEACSESATMSQLIDYEVFCKAQAKEKKKLEARLKSERRKQEKEKRMNGQSYYGFRITKPEGDKRKWIQDVLKSERTIGPPCNSEYCAKSGTRYCSKVTEQERQAMFQYFWNELDWKGKKYHVRSLVDTVPAKRRRLKHKGEISRKGDSKIYHLKLTTKIPVCRVMFLNTLGIKEAMVRCWLVGDRPKASKKPLKSINVDNYIDNLPKIATKCQYCLNNGVDFVYLNLNNVKNVFQLYNLYVSDMKGKGVCPASRKTFSKVMAAKNVRIFKPKNDNDICDVSIQHNALPSITCDKEPNIGYYFGQDNIWK